MKIAEIIALFVLIVVFFYTAFSTLPSIAKLVLIAASLFLSGAIIARLTGASNSYGLVILRGKYGFKLMENIAKAHPKLVNALADLGLSLGFGAIYSFILFKTKPKTFLLHLAALLLFFVGAGFTTSINNQTALQAGGVLFGLAGIGVISIALNAFAVLTIPNTPAGVMPVVPGVTVPWEAIFAIVLIAVIHETAHGVLFFIEKLRVKHSGALLLGFLPIGAFVEPDEKQFKKHNLQGRRRILVAGSASNFYTFLILLPLSIALLGFAASFVSGISIASISAGTPADGLLTTHQVITGVNGVATPAVGAFIDALKSTKPNQTIALTLQSGAIVPITLDKTGKIGIQVANYVAPMNQFQYAIAAFFAEVFKWIVLLSLALAMVNLLPLFVTDGHHLIRDEMSRLFPKNEKLANLTTNAMAVVILLLLLINMLPFVK